MGKGPIQKGGAQVATVLARARKPHPALEKPKESARPYQVLVT
jgi:hypothetical protein